MVDGRAAWARLGLLLLVSALGGVGMWSVVVTLPAVQAEFGVDRAGAALPYTLTMLGVAAGGIVLGRASDRLGIAPVMAIAGVALAAGFALASQAGSILPYALAHGALVGMLGSGAMFGPVMAEASLWFRRRRGLAVAIAASGNYLAGAVWPPVVAAAMQAYGWRATELAIGAAMLLTILPLSLLMRARPPADHAAAAPSGPAMAGPHPGPAAAGSRLGLAPGTLVALLCVAGVGCCAAMAMPQVHIVAYCGDLGYGAARGAEMLSLMLGLGIISRVGSGWLADRIGGLPTLLAGAALQLASLSLFLFFDGLASLFVISGLFGLVQGGLTPSYAIVVREYLPVRGIGGRVGIVIASTVVGMALGGWMTGAIFDATGSYRLAFLNGLGWNLVTCTIALLLVRRTRGPRRPSLAAAPA